MGATEKGHRLLISLYRKALRVPQFIPFVTHTHLCRTWNIQKSSQEKLGRVRSYLPSRLLNPLFHMGTMDGWVNSAD